MQAARQPRAKWNKKCMLLMIYLILFICTHVHTITHLYTCQSSLGMHVNIPKYVFECVCCPSHPCMQLDVARIHCVCNCMYSQYSEIAEPCLTRSALQVIMSLCHLPSLVPCIASPTGVGLFAWRFARRGDVYDVYLQRYSIPKDLKYA